ncbi:CPBP family intramembrane metalloprotease [Arthrobacter pityocampae]|uniref:CPBP family intramembrane metalloprotease n=1 Tax=Arthrobacter pityocampae TaxID=547334 RepID=A0A2S5IVX3_9MICC|nr:CPBP family intramembrane glutamic endopeptidase [Arthrobacter pityocampae]PPB48732.1 CPBP family intramembrane metalloprotease [Arthrobacter pityocampae]
MPASSSIERDPADRQVKPATLGQAAWALMFVVLYVALGAAAIVVAGLSGAVEFTLASLLPAFLVTVTAAAMLALYLHLVRRNRLSLAGLGFRRPTLRLFHLLWQIPVIILVCGSLQGIFLVWLSSLGVDTASAGTADDPLADIAALPVPWIVVCFLIIAVATPLWEEILFRGAFLDGLARRFRPAVAILLSAALFAALHLVLLGFVYLFTLGIALALLRRFHRNLWAPVLLHAANNALVTLTILAVV